MRLLNKRGFSVALLQIIRTPPGARVKAQLTAAECKTTKVVNVRIHMECALNRLEEFRIFKNIMPINMVPHADAINRIRGAFVICSHL